VNPTYKVLWPDSARELNPSLPTISTNTVIVQRTAYFSVESI